MNVLGLLSGGGVGGRVLNVWNHLSSSYWFIPSVMALLALVLSIAMVWADNVIGVSLFNTVPWIYINQPEGARAVLSTIAGSMITVAGVVFSITIASVVYASSQYGPRILGNFMRNRGNQITLGTFIATFVYCLLILRTVRSANEQEDVSAFVPHLSLVVGIVLAVVSVGVLIYFIHHVPDSIHLPHVVADIGRQLVERIEKLYPGEIGSEADPAPPPALPEDFQEGAVAIHAVAAGYIQGIDGSVLMHTARRHGLVVLVEHRPGAFISSGQRIALARPAGDVTEEVHEHVREAFSLGRQRTFMQDVLFPVDELAEIAARALSTGVNDPYTAINCLDWLANAVACFAGRDIPHAFRYDDEGHLRVVSYPVDPVTFTDAVFGQLMPYFAGDRNAALHMMDVLVTLAESPAAARAGAALLRHATDLHREGSRAMTQEHDRQLLAAAFREVERRLRHIAQGG